MNTLDINVSVASPTPVAQAKAAQSDLEGKAAPEHPALNKTKQDRRAATVRGGAGPVYVVTERTTQNQQRLWIGRGRHP